jgi:Zn-dependent protease with chaperone function
MSSPGGHGTMNFFDAQETARRKSGRLVVLFVAAVVAIVVVVYLVVAVALVPGGVRFDPLLFLYVALGVGLLVGGGSAFRIAGLRRGGPAVAELLGARRVSPDTTDPDERRLVNVVEEMSIASGTPVPAIYVMDGEDGINAFAAGYSTHDAAVAVTRGALLALSRDELQGVVAHEFSHILNGDMRLNIRLIGLLHGILLLAIVGRTVLYVGPRGGRGRGRDGGAGWIMVLGLALLVVGYIGVLFGRLIQAAVSRQREFLADAAAVQFTRNAEGLAGALKKIADAGAGSRIANANAEELSHLFFADGISRAVGGALATHPPISERIRRLDPGGTARPGEPAAVREAAVSGAPPAVPNRGVMPGIGVPTAAHLAFAAALLERMPASLLGAAHDPLEAKAVVLALLAASDGDDESIAGAARQLGVAGLEERVTQLLPLVREQGEDARLPLVDLALPALQRMSPDEARRFHDTIAALVSADGRRVRTFEYALLHTLSRRLVRGDADRTAASVRDIADARDALESILSAVAWAGSGDDEALAARAFAAGVDALPSRVGEIRLRSRETVGFREVDGALEVLDHASLAVRRATLEACAAAAGADGRLLRAESEMLRAIAESLDCPIPPVLPDA